MKEPRVIVVGAGASGLVAAIAAAESGALVSVLEAGSKPGRSIMASGNGRCNFCNKDLSPNRYNDPGYVGLGMGEAALEEILRFFDGLGLWYQADEEGRLYPRSRAAASVLDVLLSRLSSLGVVPEVDSKVEGIRFCGDFWEVRLADGSKRRADAVVWCAGGGSGELLGHLDGIRLTEMGRVLCPLSTDPRPSKDLDGVRVVCGVEVRRGSETVFRDRGEVLFRKYGVSGIVVFDASRYALSGDEIVLDLAPDLSLQELSADLARRAARAEGSRDPGQARLRMLDGALHPKVARHLVERVCGKDGSRPADVSRIASLVKGMSLRVTGMADAEHGQVVRGGVSNRCVDPGSFECVSQPGLYICGEALDVDGACGGLNLAWAWRSGMVAGRAAAI